MLKTDKLLKQNMQEKWRGKKGIGGGRYEMETRKLGLIRKAVTPCRRTAHHRKGMLLFSWQQCLPRDRFAGR
jgi:hypothetical protein